MILRTMMLLPLLAAIACEETDKPASNAPTPAGFTAADNVVPAALDPNRPQPPAPTFLETARDQERVPPAQP